MISAVAARKAAQTALQQSVDLKPNILPPSSTRSSTDSTGKTASSSKSKRKPSVQILKPQKKRRKKDASKNSKPGTPSVDSRNERYFGQAPIDVFETQDDIIVVDSDGEESDDAETELLKGYSLEMEHEPEAPAIKRAWSPSMPVVDSSDDEVPNDDTDTRNDFPYPLRPTSTTENLHRTLSTFQPTSDQNLFFLTPEESFSLGLSSSLSPNEGATIILLTPRETLCFLGTCTFIVLHNSISISGVSLQSSSSVHDVFAPRSAPLPIFEGASGGGSILKSLILPQRLQHLSESQSSVVLLQGLRTGAEGLGQICRTFEGIFNPSRWGRASVLAPFLIEGAYMVLERTKDIQEFSIPKSWRLALDSVHESFESRCGVYLIKGPKKCGKSTFARTLLNHLLMSYQRVAFLECDVGQSEFTPGGMVSLNVISKPLFGPPFTHPTLPNSAHYVGSTTPRSSPSHYLEAIQALIQSYRLDIERPLVPHSDDPRIDDTIPIVVNTMGWYKGLGADLTQKVEDMLEPTDVFEIQAPIIPFLQGPDISSTPTKEYLRNAPQHESSARQHILQSVPPSSLTTNYTAPDHRNLNILSYFHAMFPDQTVGELEQVTARSWNTSLPLCAIPPYEVDTSVALDNVVLTGAGSEDVVGEEIESVLNGAVIGLLQCDAGSLGDVNMEQSKIQTLPYTQQHPVPSPSTSSCVGIGLIRGISPRDSQTPVMIQMLTPIPTPLLSHARVIVKGELELPIWGMLDFRTLDNGENGDVAGVEKNRVPFLQWGKNAEGVVGAEKRRVRRNLMRKGQM